MQHTIKAGAATFAIAAVLSAAYFPAAAQAPADFFRGKSVTIYVGLSPGGGYDTNARLTGRHLGKYIPGAPTILIRNMPGAGGLVMTNHLANVAPRDGLHLGAPQRGVPFEPLLGNDSKAKFDPRLLNWIGSINADTSVTIVHRRIGIKTWSDLRNREVIIAGTGVGTESVVVPYVLRNLMGLKFKVIAGFPGGSEMNLSMVRGEVDGRGTFSWTSLKPHYKEWVESGEFIVLFQMGLRKHPDLKEIPLITDLAETEDMKRMLRVQFTAFELGRPLFAPEGVPPDRLTALRKAFDETMKDKDLLIEAEKGGMEVNPMSGLEMQDIFKDLYATPRELLARLGAASVEKPDLKVLEGAKGGGQE